MKLDLTPRTRPLLFALALAAALLAYWPGLSGGYVFDDFGNLVDNPAFAPAALHAQGFWHAVWSTHAGPLDRPLSMASFAAQAWFTGLNPWPLKLVNVLIHLFNAGLVWLLSLRVLRWLAAREQGPKLVGADTLALLVAAAWVLAPIQLTAVLYVIQREESLAATFVLLGLLAYWHGRMRLIAGRRGALAWLWGSLGLGTLLAALAKETGVMLPAYALVLEWVVLRGQLRPNATSAAVLGASPAADEPSTRRGNPLLPLFAVLLVLPAALGLAWLLPGILNGSAYAARPFTLGERLLTEGRVMVDYLRWILLPTPNALSLYHDDVRVSAGWLQPWTTAASWALLAALLASALWGWRRWPVWSLGVLWFFTGQSLVSTIVPLELVYEHRNYLPSWGVFLAAFGLLTAWSPPDAQRRGTLRLLVVGGLSALIALQGFFTFLRAQVWSNPFKLAYFEATTHPESPRAANDLGFALVSNATSPSDASYQIGMRQLEAAADIPGADLPPLKNLVLFASKFDQPIQKIWWEKMQHIIERRAITASGLSALSALLSCAVKNTCHASPQTIANLGRLLALAVQRNPNNAQLLSMRANFLLNLEHRPDKAYQLILRSVALAPSEYIYWKNLFDIQLAAGLYGDAKNVLERLRELDRFGIHRQEIARLAAALKQREQAATAAAKAAGDRAPAASPATAAEAAR